MNYIEKARKLIQIEGKALAATAELIDSEFVRAVDLILKTKGRVVVSGMGKSGLIGQKIAATMASTGTPAMFLHPAEALHGDLGMVQAKDIVLALSNSGETREILAILPSLRLIGCKIIVITGNPQSTLAMKADISLRYAIESEGCPLNLAPMASTTATLALGDALAAVIMQKRGFTARDFSLYHPHGNLGKMLTPVGDIMQKSDLPVITRQTPVSEVIDLMVTSNRGAVLVVGRKGHLRGIISDGDLKRHLRTYGPKLWQHTAVDIMVPDPKYGQPSMLLEQAVLFMHQNKISVLPIVDKNKYVIGIVQLHELMNYKPG